MNCCPNFDAETESMLFAVYDGHGGEEIFCNCSHRQLTRVLLGTAPLLCMRPVWIKLTYHAAEVDFSMVHQICHTPQHRPLF